MILNLVTVYSDREKFLNIKKIRPCTIRIHGLIHFITRDKGRSNYDNFDRKVAFRLEISIQGDTVAMP